MFQFVSDIPKFIEQVCKIKIQQSSSIEEFQFFFLAQKASQFFLPQLQYSQFGILSFLNCLFRFPQTKPNIQIHPLNYVISILPSKMALLTVFAQLTKQNEENVAAWEERLQVLKMMQAMAEAGADGKSNSTFVGRYMEAVGRERQRRGGELMRQQTKLAREEELRSELGRYESQVMQLRELLAGKEEQLQFLSQDNHRTKPTAAHCQNILLFNHESELIDKLKEEFANKGQLQREIRQLQSQQMPPNPPKAKRTPQIQKIEIKYLQRLAQQQQKRQRLQNIYKDLQAELSNLSSLNSTLAQRHQRLHPSPIFEASIMWDNSSKTICSTSDQQSL